MGRQVKCIKATAQRRGTVIVCTLTDHYIGVGSCT